MAAAPVYTPLLPSTPETNNMQKSQQKNPVPVATPPSQIAVIPSQPELGQPQYSQPTRYGGLKVSLYIYIYPCL